MSLVQEVANIWRLLTEHPLTRRRPAAAIERFLRWQIAARIHDVPRVVGFVDSSRLVVRRGMSGATGNIYVGLMEYEDMSFLLHFLREDDVFLDVGANVGAYTVLAAAVRGARAIAVEPIAASVQSLRDNLRINGVADRVQLLQTAVGEVEGVVSFSEELDTVNHVLDGADESAVKAIRVPMTTLDSICSQACPSLIKMDVEGFELPALRGGGKVLASPDCRAVIIEINGSGRRYGVEDEEIDAELRKFGFTPAAYEPEARRLTARESFANRNTIYVKDLEQAQGRLRAAPDFEVLGGRL